MKSASAYKSRLIPLWYGVLIIPDITLKQNVVKRFGIITVYSCMLYICMLLPCLVHRITKD